MTKPFQQWTVLPHGKLVQVDENILTVVGEIHMPLMDLPRRMTVVRLADASLVVFSVIALDEDDMSALEAYGRPAFLMVPSDKHRLDAKTWKDRYTEIQVVAPEGARTKVEETVAVDTVTPRFDDPGVQFMTVPGTRGREAALGPHAERHDADSERRVRQHPGRSRLSRLAAALPCAHNCCSGPRSSRWAASWCRTGRRC
jgi:hypothetical protein